MKCRVLFDVCEDPLLLLLLWLMMVLLTAVALRVLLSAC
jgi:hypothetical protein